MKKYFLRQNASLEAKEGQLILTWNNRKWVMRSGRDNAVADLAALCTLALSGKDATIFLWSDNEGETLTLRAFCPANPRWQTALILFELRCGEQITRTGLGVLGVATLCQMLLGNAEPAAVALQGGVLAAPAPEGIAINTPDGAVIWPPAMWDRIARALVLAMEAPGKTEKDPETAKPDKPKKKDKDGDAASFYIALPEANLRITRFGEAYNISFGEYRTRFTSEDIARLLDMISTMSASTPKGQVAKLHVL